MIRGIKFVTVPVRNQKEALRFYTEKLGFRVLTDQPFDEKQRWVELGLPGSESKLVLETHSPGGSDLTFCRGHLRDTVLELVRFPCKLHPCPRRGVDRELERRGHGHGRDHQAGPGTQNIGGHLDEFYAHHWCGCRFGPRSP